MTTTNIFNPRCVGTSGDRSIDIVEEYGPSQSSPKRRRLENSVPQDSWFSNAQFSSDGTTIVTQNGGQSLATFILPPDLLDGSEEQHEVQTHATTTSPTPIQSYAMYPHFTLSDPSTTLCLFAAKDVPISLNNALHNNVVHAKYPLTHPQTEEYIAPTSLLWTKNGTHFLAGSLNQISVFDASYSGSGPIKTWKTAKGRSETRLAGCIPRRGCKGTVTALSLSSNGVLAAGTRERNIALYSNEGHGDCITHFNLSDQRGDLYSANGAGITQLAWSPDGTYLLVAERQSDGIQVFDLRNSHQRVSWLSGRKADTLQKLGFDVVPTSTGYEVWAGGTDGCARMWKNPGSLEGEQEPDDILHLHDSEADSIPSFAVFDHAN